ncbi:hypothetical protein pipiens_002348 [Culex pipiens pipiens]|uniref:Uncharacterized protein n=1 Tax=Culex pipiens pipiens TaxID=38569 RepID=A0ABD1DI96_CULPP
MTVSNATHVTLRNVGFNLSGNFTCEVTADAPSFYTGVATNVLTVVEGRPTRKSPRAEKQQTDVVPSPPSSRPMVYGDSKPAAVAR